MGLLRGLLGARNLLLVIFVPLLLLPLPVLHPSSEAACAYVLIVTAVYWVSEAVPLGAAALVPAFLYPFFGVLRSSEVRPRVAQAPARVTAGPVKEGLS